MSGVSVFDDVDIPRLVAEFKGVEGDALQTKLRGLTGNQQCRVYSLYGFCKNLSHQEFEQYVELVKRVSAAHKQHYSRISHHLVPDFFSTVGALHWLPELMEEAARRNQPSLQHRIFSAANDVLSCLERLVADEGMKAVDSQTTASRWAGALAYFITEPIELDVDTLAFINKVVKSKGDNLFSAVIYTLRQRASYESKVPGISAKAIRFGELLPYFVEFLASTELNLLPANTTDAFREALYLHSYFLPQDAEAIEPGRDLLLMAMTDPHNLGKWLMNKHGRSKGAPLPIAGMQAMHSALDSAAHLNGDLKASMMFGLTVAAIHGLAKSRNRVEVDAKVLKLFLCDKDQAYIERLFSTVIRSGRTTLARVIIESFGEYSSCIPESQAAQCLERDLGL